MVYIIKNGNNFKQINGTSSKNRLYYYTFDSLCQMSHIEQQEV